MQPVVLAPGWKVDRTGEGPVKVISLEEAASMLVNKWATPIYEAQRRRIIALLDQPPRPATSTPRD